jgi:hypothetical protein
MFRRICNELCIKTRQYIRPMAAKLAGWAGLTILPEGFSMFSNDLAKQVGVERATMHQKLKGWQEHNRRYNKRSHFQAGSLVDVWHAGILVPKGVHVVECEHHPESFQRPRKSRIAAD